MVLIFDSLEIIKAIDVSLRRNTTSVINPYGKAGASDKIVDIIKKGDYIKNKIFAE